MKMLFTVLHGRGERYLTSLSISRLNQWVISSRYTPGGDVISVLLLVRE